MQRANLSDLLSASRSAGPAVTVIQGMKGLGDNIYQRAFLRQLPGPVYLETPWPELYTDMPHVLPVHVPTTLRTQRKNAEAYAGAWHTPPLVRRAQRIEYRAEGIFAGMRRTFGVEPGVLDLLDLGPSPVAGRYALVRPVTVRSEWRADTRNPLPEYVAEAADELRQRGVTVVSVADLEDGAEWAIEPLPPADVQFHRGELPMRQLLALLQGAACVVGGIGWIVPAAIAAHRPAWVVCGGQGGYNSPERITDPSMDLTAMTFAVPDRMCMCMQRSHDCDKRITNHRARFAEWLNGLPGLV